LHCASFLRTIFCVISARTCSELDRFSLKTELFREINGRFLLIEHGGPIFYCINSIRTVFPKPNNKVSKNLWSDFAQFKKILPKKPFRVEDCTSTYRRHRLLFECPVNLKLFGHVLYDTDDHTYVQSQPRHEISMCSGNIKHVSFARLLPENAFKRCIRQQDTTKTSTVTPHFYCNFRPYMTCWMFVSSFITNLWQILFPGNHLK